MTKSQNTKNEQQKDLCITSEQLTEQWKKGELPYGRYYVELAYNGNSIIMAEYWWDKTLTLDDHQYSREEVKRILAPVPSYGEWQASYNCMLENEVLRLKNAQLKELLEECRHIIGIEKDFAICHFEEYTLVELLTKIDEVLK